MEEVLTEVAMCGFPASCSPPSGSAATSSQPPKDPVGNGPSEEKSGLFPLALPSRPLSRPLRQIQLAKIRISGGGE
jgi:hypothetical protein